MTDAINQSLARLEKIPPTQLDETQGELTTLLCALRIEIDAQSGLLNAADTTQPAYRTVAVDLVDLLQLIQTTIAAQNELGKLATAAAKTMQKVWKKVPK